VDRVCAWGRFCFMLFHAVALCACFDEVLVVLCKGLVGGVGLLGGSWLGGLGGGVEIGFGGSKERVGWGGVLKVGVDRGVGW